MTTVRDRLDYLLPGPLTAMLEGCGEHTGNVSRKEVVQPAPRTAGKPKPGAEL